MRSVIPYGSALYLRQVLGRGTIVLAGVTLLAQLGSSSVSSPSRRHTLESIKEEEVQSVHGRGQIVK